MSTEQLIEKAGDAVTRALFDLGLPVSTKRTDSLHLGAAVIEAVRADIAAEALREAADEMERTVATEDVDILSIRSVTTWLRQRAMREVWVRPTPFDGDDEAGDER